MLGLGLVMEASLGMDVHNIAITFEMLLAAALMVGYYLLVPTFTTLHLIVSIVIAPDRSLTRV